MLAKQKLESGEEVVVRPAEKRDCAAILDVWNALVDEKTYTMGRDRYTLPEQEKFFDSLNEREGFLVAEVDGKVIGYSLLAIPYKASLTTHHVVEIGTYLSKEYREKGIGSVLLNASLDYAKKLKFEKVINHIRATNKRGLAFYRKAGFKQVGYLKKHLRLEGKYEDWVLMELFLDEREAPGP